VLRRRKPPLTPNFKPKVIRDSSLEIVGLIRIRISAESFPKNLWILYLVGVSHFVKIGQCLQANKSKIPYSAMARKMENYPGIRIWGPQHNQKLTSSSDC